MLVFRQFVSSAEPRLTTGRFIIHVFQDIHKQLEKKLAKFHGREDAILYAACFDANAGIFEVLMTDKDAIITDQLNHASIIDGIRLTKAKRLVFNHMDMQDLENKLKESQSCRRRLSAFFLFHTIYLV